MFISKKHLLVAALIAAIHLVATSALTSAWAMPTQELPRAPDEQRAVVVELIEELFEDNAEVMIAIAECESQGLVHVDTRGKLRRNPQSDAAGAFQVRIGVHRNEARKLGLNIEDNLYDYLSFVRHLYERDIELGGTGLRPWQSSSRCWTAKVAKNISARVVKHNQRGNIVEVAEAKD